MTHRFVARGPRRRHLWLPSGVGHRAYPRSYAAPPVGGFTPDDIEGWQIAYVGTQAAAYGGSFPANGASLTALTALYGASYALEQDAANAVPTFTEHGLGAGLHGMAFSRGAAQSLVAATNTVGTGWWDTNPSATIFLVVRFESGSVALGTQWIAGLCSPTTTNSAYHSFAIIGQTTNIIFRCSGVNSAGIDINPVPAGAIPEGENVLLMIRRRESNATGQRLHGLRDAASDASNTGGLDTITSPAALSAMQFTVGCRKWTASGVPTRDLFLDARMGAVLVYPGEMTTQQEDDTKSYLKTLFGIA